ncbi:MAG: hypothetical protein ACK4VN_10955 [Bacteroidales bacterium]
MPKTIISKLQENPQFLRQAQEKARKKKPKYKKIVFKITDTQKEALEVICKRQKTTPVRYLKSVIRKQTARYKASPQPASYVTENQLQLFEVESLPETPRSKKK